MEDILFYKYFAWHPTGSNTFKGQRLLSLNQIKVIVKDLMRCPEEQDIYTTIQNYNKDGSIANCPIYVDFDGASAQEDAKDFIKKFDEEFGVYPDIYFSGKKGFHVVVEYPIEHPRCHLAVKKLVNGLGNWFSLDQKVYTGRRLWRVPNTFHTSGGRYKIPLSPEELILFSFEEIQGLAHKRYSEPDSNIGFALATINEYGVNKINDKISEAIDSVERERVDISLSHCEGTWQENFTPCLRHMIENQPVDGECNLTLVTLAKFFKFYGVTLEDALNIILSYDHYYVRQQKERDVIKVFNSIYRSNIFSKVGCRFGTDGEIMRQYCDPLCVYNVEGVWFKQSKKTKNFAEKYKNKKGHYPEQGD